MHDYITKEAITVFVTVGDLYESLPLRDALDILTDEALDNGHYCAQTVMDLRDALKTLLKDVKIEG